MADMDVDPPETSGKKEKGGKDSSKPRFEVKKVRHSLPGLGQYLTDIHLSGTPCRFGPGVRSARFIS